MTQKTVLSKILKSFIKFQLLLYSKSFFLLFDILGILEIEHYEIKSNTIYYYQIYNIVIMDINTNNT